ncbi:uncharacterized protein IWZ02DRAFT_487277 [Phyllosticta citriasiana]|uniref:uncharacterized protein n=1 Tax=Phyllosticta citriasiana TaxID=595635 RepID=UPI0030FD5EFF
MAHGSASGKKRSFGEAQLDSSNSASQKSGKHSKSLRTSAEKTYEDDIKTDVTHQNSEDPPNNSPTEDEVYAKAYHTIEMLRAKREILANLDAKMIRIRNDVNAALNRFTEALIRVCRGTTGMVAEDFHFKEYQLVINPSDRKRYTAQEMIDRAKKHARGSKVEIYSSLRYVVGMSACIIHVTLSEVPEHFAFTDLDTIDTHDYNRVFHLGRQSRINFLQTGLKTRQELLKQSTQVLYLQDMRELDQNTFVQSVGNVIEFSELDHVDDFAPLCRPLEEYGRTLLKANDFSSDKPELEWNRRDRGDH